MDVFRLFHAPARALQREEATVWLQVGRTLWEGVPRRMRSELWHSVLLRRGTGTQAAAQYRDLLQKDIPQQTLETISRDVGRTYPDIERFASKGGQHSILRVLRAYAAYDPEIGYCQGMNFVVGLLLLYLGTEAHAFGGLVMLMEERGLRELYNQEMTLLQTRLWQVSQLVPRNLMEHLEAHGVLPVLFASSWLLTCFSSDFPLAFAARVMDTVLTNSFPAIMLKVTLEILQQSQQQLLHLSTMDGILNHLKAVVPGWPLYKLHEVVTDALSSEWTPKQLAVLHEHSGMETVHDMVKRVSLQNGPKPHSATVPHTVGLEGSILDNSDDIAEEQGKSSLRTSVNGLAEHAERRLMSFDSSDSFGGWCEAPGACEGPSDQGQVLLNDRGQPASVDPESASHDCSRVSLAANLAASSNIIDVLDVGGIDIRTDKEVAGRSLDCGLCSSSASSLLWWDPTGRSDTVQSWNELSSPVMSPGGAIGTQSSTHVSEHPRLHALSEGDLLSVGNLHLYDSLLTESVMENSLQKTGSYDRGTLPEDRENGHVVSDNAQCTAHRHPNAAVRGTFRRRRTSGLCCQFGGGGQRQKGTCEATQRTQELDSHNGFGGAGSDFCGDAVSLTTSKRASSAQMREGNAWNAVFASLDLDFALGLPPGTNPSKQSLPMVNAESDRSYKPTETRAATTAATASGDGAHCKGGSPEAHTVDVVGSPTATVMGPGVSEQGASKVGCSRCAKKNGLSREAEGSLETQILEKFTNGFLHSGGWVGQ